MKLAHALGWVLFTVWAVWLVALQARIGASADAAAWMPDLLLVFAASVLARIEARELLLLALLCALARATFSVEPALVLFAGTLGLLGLALWARSIVELTGPLWRALVAGALVLLFNAWLVGVHAARAHGLDDGPLSAWIGWRAALTSALLALCAGPLFAHLPGLTPLRRRRW